MKKAKLKIIGILNEENESLITLEKNEDFKEAFKEILKSLNFSEIDIRKFLLIEDKNKNIKENCEYFHPKISYFEDKYEKLSNQKYKIELFFGKNRIFLKIKRRGKVGMKEISKALESSKWVTQKEIKKYQKEDKEKLRKFLPKKSK